MCVVLSLMSNIAVRICYGSDIVCGIRCLNIYWSFCSYAFVLEAVMIGLSELGCIGGCSIWYQLIFYGEDSWKLYLYSPGIAYFGPDSFICVITWLVYFFEFRNGIYFLVWWFCVMYSFGLMLLIGCWLRSGLCFMFYIFNPSIYLGSKMCVHVTIYLLANLVKMFLFWFGIYTWWFVEKNIDEWDVSKLDDDEYVRYVCGIEK